MDHLIDSTQRHANGNYWLGVIMGATFTALVAMALHKLTVEPHPMQAYIAQDVIDAYRQGADDSLKTNPPSAALEMTCLELWANKQPR